ncbi:MAG: hypothetical protein KKD38_07095, partial [Candidatus Delongbacteria bacterium]|nr:hypothetical protein [Candidatus Delongbacteria bacterium]
MIRQFIKFNNKISDYFRKKLPQEKIHAENAYLNEILKIINNAKKPIRILDVGAGKNSIIANYKNG